LSKRKITKKRFSYESACFKAKLSFYSVLVLDAKYRQKPSAVYVYPELFPFLLDNYDDFRVIYAFVRITFSGVHKAA